MSAAPEPSRPPPEPRRTSPDPPGTPASMSQADAPTPAADGGDPPPFRLSRQPGLDGLRGLAVLTVILFHAKFLVRAADTGLTIFFVLSSFLITVLVLQEWRDSGGVALRHFYARRALRILPALVLFTVAAGIYVQLTASQTTARAQWVSVLASLGMVANWVEALTTHPLLLVQHTWSVAVEVHFYLLWPVLLLLLLRRGVRPRRLVVGLLVAAGLVLAVRAAWWYGEWTVQDRLFGRLFVGTDMRIDHLALGSALGVVAVSGWLPVRVAARRAVGGLAAAGLVAVVVVALVGPPPGVTFAGGSTLVALAAAAAIAACLVAPAGSVPRLLRSPALVWLGKISYGAYLWHVPLFRIMREHVIHWPLPVRTAVGITATLLLASASYYTIERWFLRRKRRFRPRPTPAAAAAGGPPAPVPGPAPHPASPG